MRAIRSVLAALSLYTRLPAWRLLSLDSSDFSRCAEAWSAVGLVTGGVFALVWWGGASLCFSPMVVVVLSVLSRLLLTGAFHEDGLGDFFDGFGATTDRERILEIMKDSRVGSYAVVGYILYYLLFVALFVELAPHLSIPVFVLGDVLSKQVSLAQVRFLPYARTQEASKLSLVYRSDLPWGWLSISIALGVFFGIYAGWLPLSIAFACLGTIFVGGGLILYIRRRLSGYTGDTCGAVFMLSELSYYLSWALAVRLMESYLRA